MTAILGISAFYHDSAAALVVDGQIVAAAQEERFTRIKHDPDFPSRAVEYCLQAAGLEQADLDFVVFYDKPLVKFERLLETYLAFAPRGFRSFRMAIPIWLKDKLHLRRAMRKHLPEAKRARFVFTDHHQSHAASAFFPCPFAEAAVMTLDGVGEWTTTAWGVGQGNRVEMREQVEFPHSLGLLYSAFTYYCGFKVNSGEYKLMGLAPYGKPVYRDKILEHLIDLRADGSLRMDMQYFNYCQGLTMTAAPFHELFGGPPRSPESMLEPRHMDLAASVQAVTEEAVMRMARHVHDQTGQKNLVLAGGVALNCVANGKLLRGGPFEKIWIQPAAGDAGGALGGALFVWHQLLDKPRSAQPHDQQSGSLLGPQYSNEEIQRFLQSVDAPSERYATEEELLERVAALLSEDKIVGWFQGRMEFGPRALGGRSILADPRSPTAQANLNLKIKFRESFRPFAPSVMAEHAHEWFEFRPDQDSPYMLLVAPVVEGQRVAIDAEQQRIMQEDPDLRRRVNIVRSSIPAVTHVDYSARVQTVSEQRNGRYYRLIKAFYERTGCPIVVNTSFNVRGEPIVCTPQEAYRCFLATDMDVLVLENHVLVKQPGQHAAAQAERQKYLAQFALD